MGGVDPPIAPLNETSLDPAAKLNAWAPLTVPVTEILAPVVPLLSVTSPFKVIGLAIEKLIVWLLVWIVPERTTGPVPFCKKKPSMLLVSEEVDVKVPLFVTVSGPPAVVVIFPVLVKLFTMKVIPEALLVFRSPVIERSPEEVIAIEEAEIPAVVTLTAPVMVKVPTRVDDPTPEKNVMSCAEDTVILPLPSTRPLMTIL